MSSQQPDPGRRRTREEYEGGLPGYHDPTAGFGALTLRAWLAAFGLVVCAVAAVLFAQIGAGLWAAAFGVLAVIALVDLGWVLHRKRRGEPG
jgi:O-antigen/teichoic acid export membrane protein